MHAQLGFCNGNSGDPIFIEDFGTGVSNEPMLPTGTTTYIYTPNFNPIDGYYTVTASTNAYGWDLTEDHTPNDVNGKSLVINGDFTPGEFFQITVSGLCENTSYEFSSWLKNILPSNDFCPSTSIPVNVKFEIRDISNTKVLASGDTGNIPGVASPKWEQYALVFQTLPNQTSVILKMINNSSGGCGNDLAIDDIVFKTCGDYITINDLLNNGSAVICEDDLTFSTQLKAISDFSVFSTHYYQWQQSFDKEYWVDIIGENAITYRTPIINQSTYYRVVVSEDEVNLKNNSCNTISEIFEFEIIPFPLPPSSNGDLNLCDTSENPISVSIFNTNSAVNWYDLPTGGNLVQSNSFTFFPATAGTYYAEAVSSLTTCPSQTRTPVTVTYLETPIAINESHSFCEGESLIINTNVTNPSAVTSYLWNNESTNDEIEVFEKGTYSVEIFNNECSITKSITISTIDIPENVSVFSENENIVVNVKNNSDLEYSIDGVTYQSNPVFENITSGLYSIYVKNINCNVASITEFIHFYIPKFFTPNNDGFNDLLNVEAITLFPNSSFSIYDRFGKLIKFISTSPYSWNGELAGKGMPTDSYWYFANLNGAKKTGYFTLKR